MNIKISRILLGVFLGFIVGIIDIIPMLINGLSSNAVLSALSMWVVIGVSLQVVSLKINRFASGIIVSFLVLIPNLFIIAKNSFLNLIPIFIMTLILGALLGYLTDKFNKR